MAIQAPELHPDVAALVGAIRGMVAVQGAQQRGGWGFGNPYTQGFPMGGRDVLEASPAVGIYGNHNQGVGLFSLCGDRDIISLLVRDEGFLRWLRWSPNNFVSRPVKMITYVGPDGTADHAVSAGWLADDCEPPNSVEYGKCEIDFVKGLYGRCGQDISAITLGERYCDAEPTYRIDGTLINNDAEWQAAVAAMVLRDDISEGLITANHTTDGQFDGLEQLVDNNYHDFRTGLRCSQADSIVIDWNNQGVAGLVGVIAEIVARIRMRARDLGGVNPADMVIMLPAFMRDCIVDLYACENPCGDGSAGNPITVITTDAIANRNRYLTGGQYGDGFISVNGVPISFLVNDWVPWASCPGGGAGSYVTDIYILTRQVGPRQVVFGEYQNLSQASEYLNRVFGGGHRVTDGGRFVVYGRKDELCFNECIVTRPGLVVSAPWAQARIANVCCTVDQLTPLSPDPDSEYFLDYGSLYTAADSHAFA
jgi:hypothetical protein